MQVSFPPWGFVISCHPMAVGSRGQCEKHQLPLDARGECELCRLSAMPSRPPPSRATAWLIILIVILLAGGAVAAIGARSEFGVEPPEPGGSTQARPPAPLPTDDVRPTPAPAPDPRTDRPSSVPLPPSPSQPGGEIRTAPVPAPPPAEPDQRDFTEDEAKAALSEVRIEMYATSWCESCQRAREYFDYNNFTYTEYDIDEDSSAKERLSAMNPERSIPTFQIDDIVQIGFSPETLEYKLNQAVRERLYR